MIEEQEYEHSSECQDYADYGMDGYHPVYLGQKFNHKYVVIQKLGWGHFSTVWLVQNDQTKEYGALKIQRSKENHAESAIDEMQILKAIRQHEENPEWISYLQQYEQTYPEQINAKLCRPLLLLDSFPHFGIHGKHYCSLFQILGPNLLDLIQHYEFKDKRMPLWLVKKITIDVLLGLVYLHEYCSLIHTDLKPENIMIKLEPYEEEELISSIKKYTVKPMSMKFLKNLQASKNPKSKKKNQKKKLKKKMKKENELKKNKEEGEAIEEESQLSSSQQQIQEEKPDEKVEEPQKSNIKEIQKVDKVQSSETQKIKQQPQNQPKQVEAELPKEKSNQAIFQEGEEKHEEVDMSILRWKNVEIQLNNRLFFKVVDMGNACFTNKHFTEDIQTREYRSPEVILGHEYFPNTDIWSLACTVFEMMTNNFLFKPKKIEGISKNEDHLYKMMEVLSPFPNDFCTGGTESSQYFNKKGKLIHGQPKKQVSLHELLHEDFGYSLQDAVEAEQFLLPMLEPLPEKRVSARQCLKHAWLWK